ncbi:hypothetical protein PHSC3_000523 [Chlamydiales bacterium STE3]|nr:hypothetical protein PHSC3_000523 [Chlamydiales bacterium STE3]
MKKNQSFYGLFLFIIFCTASTVQSDETIIYHSQDPKSAEQALGYTKTNQSLSRYLAYRDIPSFINQYANGKETLDFGAGVGFSTQFLLQQNLNVIGADISDEMIAQAKINCPNVPFYLIENGTIPFHSETCDIVFSSLVLFEVGSEREMLSYLEEAKRMMKTDGVFIAITGSQDAYTKDWLIFDTNFPENKNLKSGDLAKTYLRDAGIEFTDYYWTEADYRDFFKLAGFDLLEVHYPKGKDNEPYPWKDELTSSPFVIFVAKKATLKT